MNRMLIATAFVFASIEAASAQGHGHTHADHTTDTEHRTIPTEGGQASFTAIAEIVALLSDDPTTDWATVDIDALHEHLIDMELLTTETRVATAPLDNGARFTVYADGRAKEAVQRMVTAHAPFLAEATGWITQVEVTNDGATLTVTAETEAHVTKIQALGFYGVMATDSHHQEHHLAIAKGYLHR